MESSGGVSTFEFTEGVVISPELIPNETRLDRLQIIERCFTPAEHITGRRIVDQLIDLKGAGELAKIAPTSSFIMPQVRKEYDANHIERIGRNMRDSPGGQLQNAGIALISNDHIDQYLEDLNIFFETQIGHKEVNYHEKFGGYLVTIFGHNRQLGMGAANREVSGHPDHGTALFAKVFRNPPFWQVLEMQAVENTGLMPDMWDRSRAIVQYKNLRTRDGIPPTQQEIADKFGVDSDQVWRAERYEALPVKIKNMVVAGKLPYSGAFELDRLFDYYEKDDVIHLAGRLAERKASTGQIVNEVQKRLIVAHLTPEVYVMVDEGVITLPQAQELNRLKQVGLGGDRINEIADWICLKRPDISEIRKAVTNAIDIQLSGVISLLDEGGLDPEEREKMLMQMHHDTQADLIRTNSTDLSRSLRGLAAAYHIGRIAPEVAARAPVRANIDHEFSDFLERVVAGDITGIDPATLEKLDEILITEEAIASGEITETPLMIAAKSLMARVQKDEPAQEQLFS